MGDREARREWFHRLCVDEISTLLHWAQRRYWSDVEAAFLSLDPLTPPHVVAAVLAGEEPPPWITRSTDVLAVEPGTGERQLTRRSSVHASAPTAREFPAGSCLAAVRQAVLAGDLRLAPAGPQPTAFDLSAPAWPVQALCLLNPATCVEWFQRGYWHLDEASDENMTERALAAEVGRNASVVKVDPASAGATGGAAEKFNAGVQVLVDRIVGECGGDESSPVSAAAVRCALKKRVSAAGGEWETGISDCDSVTIHGGRIHWNDRHGTAHSRSLRTLDTYIRRSRQKARD